MASFLYLAAELLLLLQYCLCHNNGQQAIKAPTKHLRQ